MGLDHSIANMFRYCDSLDGTFSKLITVDDIKTMIANARADLAAKIGSTAAETRIPVGLEDYVEQRYKRIRNENLTERLVDLACMGYNGSLGLTGTGIPCSGMIYDIQMFVAREGFGPNGVGTRSSLQRRRWCWRCWRCCMNLEEPPESINDQSKKVNIAQRPCRQLASLMALERNYCAWVTPLNLP